MPSHSIARSNLVEAAFPDTVSIGVPLQLLSNRPDVRQAEMELAQAFYTTNAARAAFYPISPFREHLDGPITVAV